MELNHGGKRGKGLITNVYFTPYLSVLSPCSHGTSRFIIVFDVLMHTLAYLLFLSFA